MSGGEKLIRDYLGGLKGKVIVSHRNQFAYPISFFWFPTKLRTEPGRNFDFQISPYLQSLFLRLGPISFFARADGGYVRRHGAHIFQEFLGRELAPIQIEELAAHFFTMGELAKGDHLVRRERLPGGRTVVTRVEIPRKEPFYPLTEKEEPFMSWFAYFTGASKSELLMDHGLRRTYLARESGEYLDCPADFGWH
jgi:hypothetical protein